ncbi:MULTISPECIES: efflux transporter outer membrane subunit [Sphingobium]|uniref:efflux transporter outer membrane subunit n=1 Tax=Sphingobium TaxID=165695 RepID=UPI0015EC8F36|nr:MULTISPECIES: efflux transporter outer membrane subunit [Sphingobium]MCW2361454.1 NodT family efflux transporter outer membrane factor (OMF) lipoprotein [Sphingobium sp. B10D3B]MCW2401867.1 NodT family efflux transporter outer membrane factor (OMF) lipoprotein [Sphingobium sp. B10D7B]MCW2408846.1 NodT family efflux transporter outer membrane factor (OMF) lipoprotein [Sphingobium xanthum]
MRKFALAALLLTSACSMNPRLETPPAPVAPVYPLASPEEAASAAALDWREMFGDPRLQRLIELALENNRDLRVATLNVEAARAQFRVARGAQLPTLDASAAYSRQRVSAAASQTGAGAEFSQFSANAALTSFEIDLFGRLRSQSEAAFERYLATDEGRRAARIALIGSIVDAYLAERLAEEQLALTDRTLGDWQDSLAITRRLQQARQVSGLDVAQAEGQVSQAQADQAMRTRMLAEARNALQLLVGAPLPADLPAPIALMDQPIRTQLPVGLPSALLASRPDIRQAEHELVASNADVGAARAAFFPRISLTGLFGFTSMALDSLFDSANRSWSFTPQITQSIFNGGSLQGQLDLAKVRKSIAIANYEKAIQSAFREVADGLAGRETYTRQIEAQRGVAQSAARRAELSRLRYQAGVDARLELLDAQRSEYAARLALLELRRQELSSAAGLYRALGGGDEPTAATAGQPTPPNSQ